MGGSFLSVGDCRPVNGAARDRKRRACDDNAQQVRALVVSNMAPTEADPARGAFVRTQVAALRRAGDAEVELYEFRPGDYLRAARELLRMRGFDIVHAHFGLTAWPALAVRNAKRAVTLHGTDVRHPRSWAITRAALGRMDLVAAASEELAALVRERRPGTTVEVLPAGVDLDRFRPLDRAECRARLNLDTGARLALLPADPARPEKRADRARQAAERAGAQLLTLGHVEPDEVPTWVNAADVVLVPSDREGFGLAVLEALACDVPVLATPVGVHAQALAGVAGTLCAEFDEAAWASAIESAPPRVEGRERAARWGADAMAQRVIAAWRSLVDSTPEAPGTGAAAVS
jgi:glycosyltransferase involved in cell wall biosynthesis